MSQLAGKRIQSAITHCITAHLSFLLLETALQSSFGFHEPDTLWSVQDGYFVEHPSIWTYGCSPVIWFGSTSLAGTTQRRCSVLFASWQVVCDSRLSPYRLCPVQLLKIISARLLHDKVTIFPFLMNKYSVGWYSVTMQISHFSSEFYFTYENVRIHSFPFYLLC